eukprot:evm.model.scf_2789.2 EVM.evm.TU.scf_2789.2   scf_2789:17241-18463(+)
MAKSICGPSSSGRCQQGRVEEQMKQLESDNQRLRAELLDTKEELKRARDELRKRQSCSQPAPKDTRRKRSKWMLKEEEDQATPLNWRLRRVRSKPDPSWFSTIGNELSRLAIQWESFKVHDWPNVLRRVRLAHQNRRS